MSSPIQVGLKESLDIMSPPEIEAPKNVAAAAPTHKAVLISGNIMGLFFSTCLLFISDILSEAVVGANLHKYRPVSMTVAAFVSSAFFVGLTALMGCIGAALKVQWLLLMYTGFLGVVVVIELMVCYVGWFIKSALEEAIRQFQCSPCDRTAIPFIESLSQLSSSVLLLVVMFQLVLIWSGHRYYLFLHNFDRPQVYHLKRVIET
jgi:hypothetical protein